MKKIIILIIFSIFTLSIHAQVGINTTTPDESAALQINGGGGKGLLIPVMSLSDRNGLLSDGKKPNGLLVYDDTQKIFYYCNGTGWIALNPLLAKDESTGFLNLSDGSSIITFDENDIVIAKTLTVNGNTTHKNPVFIDNTLTVKYDINANSSIVGDKNIIAKDTIKASVIEGLGVTPIGGIIMWSGATPPNGWVLCIGGAVNDAQSPINTRPIPDLRGRFIVGAGQFSSTETREVEKPNYQIGDKGGINKYVLSVPEMPRHRHLFSLHTETDWGDDAEDRPFPDDTPIASNSKKYTDYQGDNQPHENRPPYYVLAFIMRVK